MSLDGRESQGGIRSRSRIAIEECSERVKTGLQFHSLVVVRGYISRLGGMMPARSRHMPAGVTFTLGLSTRTALRDSGIIQSCPAVRGLSQGLGTKSLPG